MIKKKYPTNSDITSLLSAVQNSLNLKNPQTQTSNNENHLFKRKKKEKLIFGRFSFPFSTLFGRKQLLLYVLP